MLGPFANDPWARIALGLAILLAAAFFARIVVQHVLLRTMRVIIERTAWRWDDAMLHHGVFHRIAQMVPFFVIQLGIEWIGDIPLRVDAVVRNVALAMAVLYGTLALSAALDALHDIYARTENARIRSIKGYVQLGKISLFVIAAIVIVASLIDRSPWLLLSGLGAMSAVLLLVFKDTLLSLVASVLLTSNDMLRVGDWIEMQQVGADGDVIDIALHTVKVQNWDKTITTIPTWRLISESFRNWRGMQQAGGRRIKRTIRLDAGSVRFLTDAEVARMSQLRLLAPYLTQKHEAITHANQALGDYAQVPANTRRLTNLGTFRAYVQAYLDDHPGIHTGMTRMVRLLEPGADGTPVELYCFTKSTAWADYEAVQGDIFDHLLAILPEFSLSLYQNPGGRDLRMAFPSGPR